MLLNVLVSEVDVFWENQNQKLLGHPDFLDEGGNIYDDTLQFKNPRSGITKLDFSIFDLPHVALNEPATLRLKGDNYSLTTKEYAKLFVLSNVSSGSSHSVIAVFQMLVCSFAFLNNQSQLILTKENIEYFNTFFLTQSVNRKGLFTRLSTPSYAGTFGTFQFIKTRNKLQSIGVTGLMAHNLTQKVLSKALDEACRTQLGITLNEYQKGGSFNFLGLELGQCYIDYLRQVYEQDYFYTLVCRKALEVVHLKYGVDDKVRFSDTKSKYNITNLLRDSILGKLPDSLNKTTKGIYHQEIYDDTVKELYLQYEIHREKVLSLSEENIQSLVLSLGLEDRFDSIEIIRILMLHKYQPFDSHKTAEKIWNGYLTSLDKTLMENDKLSKLKACDVYSKMNNLLASQKLGENDFIVSLNHWATDLMHKAEKNGKEKSIRGLMGEFERVSHAMTCLVAAWLGYRKSEFGFPLSAISVEPNIDIFDNSHVPFRFKLKWLVPKTNGATKLDREITSQCYQVASQLNYLFRPKKGKPCLYETIGGNKNKDVSSESAIYLDQRIKANWAYFVNFYQPFVDVRELDHLSQQKPHDMLDNDKARLDVLQGKYNLESSFVSKLLENAKKSREELPKLRCTSFFGKAQKSFRASLIEFNQKGLITNIEHKDVIEKCLSKETLVWLRSDDLVLDFKASRDIINEILQGVRYPTPHSLRHIWAEAVLTRYQGNVGAVIRHQFCHLDNSFFMSYLRDKAPQQLIKSARLRVLNSIVDTLLLESEGAGKTYIGGFSRYVKKIKGITKIVTPNELLKLRKRISGGVISIHINPFATCVLRDGAEHRAMCSEFGISNPHNANVSFCLNCANAVITEGNLKGIWLSLQPMVKESLDKNVFGFMIEQHIPTLRSGYKRIKELKTVENEASVFKILTFIKKALSSIELKLKSEEVLYG